jgi:predicted SprT family Zn-dependent metalloprotease
MEIDKAFTLIKSLMGEHGLIEQGWSFEFSRAITICGYCNYTKKKIVLSRHFVKLNDIGDIRDIALHEIAHALTPEDAGHGPAWKAKCLELGCSPNRLVENIVSCPRKYVATCKVCKQKFYRQRLTSGMSRLYCSKCNTFRPSTKLIWYVNFHN